MARRLRLALHLCALGLLGALTARGAPPAESVSKVCTDGSVSVRAAPDWKAARRGLLLDCAVVVIGQQRDGPGCKAPWAELDGGGWICLDFAAPTSEPVPETHPLLAFDHPNPDELPAYRTTGQFDRAIGPAAEALLPYVYGRRSGRFAGRCYADVQSEARGEEPVGLLDPTRRQAFVEVIETDDGGFLRRPDGTVVPVDDVFLYAPSRFVGIDLVASPGPDASSPAWVRAGGGNWRDDASIESLVLDQLAGRTLVFVGAPETGRDGRSWCPVRQLDGAPVLGFVAASRLRRHRPEAPPADLPEGAVWLDVDLDQQVLAVMRGTRAEFVTLVSTGVGPEHGTPPGIYRIADKMLHWDMASRDGADDPYHLEEVPWVMHFWPRYALHGAFWHDGFGEPRSHGCINLDPRDAHVVFDRTSPAVPPGWHTAWESPEEPGTVLRVREDGAECPDRRRPL